MKNAYFINTMKTHKTSNVVPSYTFGVQICIGNIDNLKNTASITSVKPIVNNKFISPDESILSIAKATTEKSNEPIAAKMATKPANNSTDDNAPSEKYVIPDSKPPYVNVRVAIV